MNLKKLYDAAMIFLIGSSPLAFQYLKGNVEMTNIISNLQRDVDQIKSDDSTN